MMKPGGTGWNDPPKLSHQVHSETKTRRNLLNKRVAYLDHLTSKSNNNATTMLPNISPPTDVVSVTEICQPKAGTSTSQLNIFVPGCEGVSLPTTAQEENLSETESINPEETIDIVSSLLSVTDKCKTDKNSSATKDIEKKLEILKSMLQEKSLSEGVVVGMKQLTLHLLNKQYQKAWDIHVSLMCDHVSEVRQWMVGVKRLINELRKTNFAS